MPITLSYDDIVLQILAKSTHTKEEIESRIAEKITALSGLVSREGAAHVVATELGVVLLDGLKRSMPLKDIVPGMNQINVEGTVQTVFPLKEFSRQNPDGSQRQGRLLSFLLQDATGQVRVVLWDDLAKVNGHLREGTFVRMSECRSVDGYRGGVELHSTSRSLVELLEESTPAVTTLHVGGILEENNNTVVQMSGTIVDVFPPVYFEICPKCGKRLQRKEQLVCVAHGVVQAAYSCVISLFVDDGTGILRTVLFFEQASAFFKIPLLDYRERKEELVKVLRIFLGEEISCTGRLSYNDRYARHELIVTNARMSVPEDFLVNG